MRKVIGVALLLTGACVPSEFGRPINLADTQRLTPGQSTLADAKALFGEPGSCVAMANGIMNCAWAHTRITYDSANPGQTTMVSLFFDKDGRMIENPYMPQQPVPVKVVQ